MVVMLMTMTMMMIIIIIIVIIIKIFLVRRIERGRLFVKPPAPIGRVGFTPFAGVIASLRSPSLPRTCSNGRLLSIDAGADVPSQVLLPLRGAFTASVGPS